MKDHQYFTIDQKWFDKLFDESHTVFLPQASFEQDLRTVVERHRQASGELFINKLDVVSEPLSVLARKSVNEICKRCGYRVLAIENTSVKGAYLGSDGGGHYSSDFYEMIEYARITITAA